MEKINPTIETQLFAILDKDDSRKKYRYLLIDNLSAISELDVIYLDNLQQILGDYAITTIIRPELSHELEYCPKLITLAKPHRAIEEQITHFSLVQAFEELNCEKRYVCSWLVSELPPDIIAEQMINIGQLIGQRCKRTFIPIYEPFRMQLLHESNQISDQWLPTILNFFDSYTYLNVNGELKTIKRSIISLPSELDLFITEESKFYQQEAKNIFLLYQSWHDFCEKTDRMIDDNYVMNVAQAYLKACQTGLTATKDKFIFTLMTLRYGDLMSNFKLSTAVKESINDPETLRERFQSIKRDVFEFNPIKK